MRLPIATLLCLAPLAATAAEFSRGGDTYLGCTVTLTGPIQTGDAARLAQFLDTRAEFPRNGRLCLDSPGGSLIEAIRMGDIIADRTITTGVPRGASCASACAVLFMAGTEELTGDGLTAPNRLLHAAGTLGFHAPSIDVPKGEFTEAEVSRAYDIAIASLAEVSARKNAWGLADSLLTTMLRTPPSQMYMVDTVYDAAVWDIAVVGTIYLDEITPLAAANACTKSYAYRRETGLANRASTPLGPEYRYGYEPARLDTDFGPAIRLYGYGDEGSMETCHILLPKAAPTAADTLNATGIIGYDRPFAEVSWLLGDDRGIMPSAFFPNATPLSAIARPDDGTIVTASLADFTGPEIDTVTEGRCTVWRDTRQSDSEPCTETRLVETSQELVRTDSRRYLWPSGASTLVEDISQRGVTVNGSPAEVIYEWDNPPVTDGPCWLNTASGNTFCFQPSR